MTPQFHHYCEKCTYLGSTPNADFYVCNNWVNADTGTLLARFSDEDSDYSSVPVGYVPDYGPNPQYPEACRLHEAQFALMNAFYQYHLARQRRDGM